VSLAFPVEGDASDPGCKEPHPAIHVGMMMMSYSALWCCVLGAGRQAPLRVSGVRCLASRCAKRNSRPPLGWDQRMPMLVTWLIYAALPVTRYGLRGWRGKRAMGADRYYVGCCSISSSTSNYVSCRWHKQSRAV
jgi:hypothetical protein